MRPKSHSIENIFTFSYFSKFSPTLPSMQILTLVCLQKKQRPMDFMQWENPFRFGILCKNILKNNLIVQQRYPFCCQVFSSKVILIPLAAGLYIILLVYTNNPSICHRPTRCLASNGASEPNSVHISTTQLFWQLT